MTSAAAARYVQAARSVSRGGFIALGASIPISIALDNILIGIIVVSWLAAAHYDDTFRRVRRNPVALLALAWIVVHLLGATYSMGDTSDVARALRRAATFLLIPIAIAVMHDPIDRTRAFGAFAAAIAVTIALSALRSVGVIPVEAPLLVPGGPSASLVFKARVTHSLLLAFGAFVLAVYAREAQTRGWKAALYALAAAALTLVVFVGEGRTGQLIALALIVYYGAWAGRARGTGWALAAVVALLGLAFALPQSGMHQRAALMAEEAADWHAEGAAGPTSSVGQRLEFYTTTLEIAAKHPLIGVGTGGFAAAYAQTALDKGHRPTRNPHNEYLLKATELGIVGLLLLIALFWVAWRSAGRLAREPDRALARGAVIAIAIASAVSSTLSDHTENLLLVWVIGIVFAGFRSESA